MPVPPENLTGKTFGKLIVLKMTKERDNCRSVIWIAKCTCPKAPIIKVPARSLKSGTTKSCGCHHIECARQQGLNNKKHGACKSVSKEGNTQLDYAIWRSMKQRCYDKKSKPYKNYGGRSIRVNEKWRKDFISFAVYIRTLENCPNEKLLKSRVSIERLPFSIDRINNDGNYEPGNIKWSTLIEQANNRRTNLIVKYKGKTLTLAQAVREYSANKYCTVYYRFVTAGWSLHRALTA